MKLARVLVLIGVVGLGQVPAAVAGGLVQSANRLAQQAGRQAPATPSSSLARDAAGQQPGAQTTNTSSRKKKVWLFVVAGLGVAGGIYAIDHGVEDNTLSSRGLRKD